MAKRVKNKQRGVPLDKKAVLSQFATLFKDLPGLSLNSPNAPYHAFGMIAKSPKTAKLFVPYWAKSKSALGITFRESEILILKVADYFGCNYIWGHHVLLALQSGMSQEEISQITLDPSKINLPEKEIVLIKTAELILSSANLDDQAFESLSKHYLEKQIIDIFMVISQYLFFATINNVFGIELENDSMPNLSEDK